ncbi:MAG: S8 family serine peptidase [Oligoflexia bacterium]|nr:S8 family serine peptidase [Oligoflexia bacterium]
MKLLFPKSYPPSSISLTLNAAVLALGLGSSCTPKIMVPDELRIEQVIESAQSGELNERISKDLEGRKALTPAFENGLGEGDESEGDEGVGAEEEAPVVKDPCPEVAAPAANAGRDVLRAALREFVACARAQYEPVEAVSKAIRFFKVYRLDESERPLSAMADSEILAYIDENYIDPVSFLVESSERERKVRSSFSDAELEELLLLVGRKYTALEEAEARVYAAMDARPELVRYFANISERFRIIQILHDTAGDAEGNETAEALAEILERGNLYAPSAAELRDFPSWMLHPYALEAVLPEPGREEAPLRSGAENPFIAVLRMQGELAGAPGIVMQTLANYMQARDMDNPALPEHPAAAPDAVRVAVLDSGIDFLRYPDLGLFLGNGKDGQLSSGDFVDADPNPWLPADGASFSHGSATSASVLTVMSHYAPELLRSRKLDLAMWKLYSIRDYLAGPLKDRVDWSSRFGVPEAIISRIEGAQVKPKIVSVSMGFMRLGELFTQLGRQGVLLKAPWLWVMAAGNSGVELSQEAFSGCFDDFPAEERPDARILCVGALKQGIVNDVIAGYSNFGKRVDVYAFDSYIQLCPSGTSCATPAVAGAVAVIAGKYPSLTPEQLKEVILEAAEEKTLKVEYDSPGLAALATSQGLPAERTVKVFNPGAMIPRALEIARRKALGAPAPTPALPALLGRLLQNF